MSSRPDAGQEFIDKLRFGHFVGGATVEEIAELEGVDAAIVQASVERERRNRQIVTHFELMELRRHGALQNERFRKRLREELADEVARAIEKLRSHGIRVDGR